MDIAFRNICEVISISGPHGISWDQFKTSIKSLMNLKDEQLIWPPCHPFMYILNIYAGLKGDFLIGQYKSSELLKKDQKTRLMFYTDLRPVELDEAIKLSDPSSLRFYCSKPPLRHSALFQGRPIQLSESSLQVLEVIAAHGRNGLTQAELAKVLGCDSKNAFHWLKSLISNDLIARTPVASKKSFTYLLTLTRFLDEDIRASSHSETHTVVSSKEIRQSIIDILAKAPNQTMVSKDVFLQTGLDPLLIKNFRRAATKLNEIGWLEYLFEDQLLGPCCRLFRLKRKPSEGLDLKAFLTAQNEAKKQDVKEISLNIVPLGSDYRPDHPILHQMISLLSQFFPEPLTTSDLSHRLNIPRKYLYKLIDRIVPPSGKKAGVVGAEGVGKVSDFVGKEKRLKLFIKSEEWRDYYMNLFKEIAGYDAPDIPSSLISSRPTTPLIQESSTQQSPSDTRTRQLRHQAILQELAHHRILEIGKDLCHRIQSILGDTRFTLDLKTLRRSIEILEREGKLKVVVAALPTGTKSLLISPDLSASDQLVQQHIAKLSETSRNAPLSASTLKLEKIKELVQQPDFFVEGSLPLGVPQNPSVSTRALTRFGFISGVLARAQLFHEFLLSNSDDSFGFETIPTIFERMPLSLYIKIIGLVRMSKNLYESLESFRLVSLIDLPEIYRDELTLNRKRFQSQVSILLGILEDLKLIQGESQFASLNFKLPFRYNFALDVPLFNYKGEIVKIIKFSHDSELSGFKEFWAGLRQISHDYSHSKTISIHSDENDSEVSKVILLSRHSESWRDKPSRERELEKIVRKLASELKSLTDEDLIMKINAIVSEFEVSNERIKTMLDNYKMILEEREESKRLAKRRFKEEGYEDDEYPEDKYKENVTNNADDSDSDDTGTTDRWTQSDWSILSLAFCILQQPFFLSSNSNTAATGIKWNLAAKAFDKPKSPIIIRRHGLKLFKNYRELAKMVETDSLVRLIMKSLNLQSEDDLSQNFMTVFDKCKSELNDVNSSELILSNFCQNVQSTDSFEILSNRQEHYLSAIDSWVQTRSFRHGLLQSQNGLNNANESIESNNYEILTKSQLALRQILVYSSYCASFDYDAISLFIKSIDPSDLSSSIEYLTLSGFASKNKARDQRRLFSFPLVISETVRDILEYQSVQNTCEDEIITNNTETLSVKKIEGFIDSYFSEAIDIEIIKPDESTKFDAPIKFKTHEKSIDNANYSTVSYLSESRALWINPLTHSIEQQILANCLGHLQNTIKSQPGITLSDLKRKYENVLENFEVDCLVKCLLESKGISMISDKFLFLQ